MSNEIIAIILMAFYLVCSRKIDLCFAILTYYLACILTNAYTVGYHYASCPEWFYIQQSAIDLSAIIFICYLSRFHKQAANIYLAYVAIISVSMLLNGLMLLDQYTNTGLVYRAHLLYQQYAQAIDVVFAVIGSANVAKYFVRFLPFSNR